LTGEDETENTELQDAIHQVIKDSNLANNKAPMIRGFSLYGDSFIRVRGDKEKTYLEDLSVFYVTDFGEDSRGFLTYLRIDIPILDDSDLPANLHRSIGTWKRKPSKAGRDKQPARLQSTN
jgi:hypothetical protein